MVKKILKAILAVLAVVTAFICGAYVQSSTGRQMPVMAQRKNAISPDSINNILNFNVNEMPSLFYFNDDEQYSYAYDYVGFDYNLEGNTDEVLYATGYDFSVPSFTYFSFDFDSLERTTDSHIVEFVFSIDEYIDYITNTSYVQDYIFENNLNNDTLFYFYLGKCDAYIFNTYEGTINFDLTNIYIKYKDGTINYLYDFGAEEIRPYFNRILDIKDFVFAYDVVINTPVDSYNTISLTQYFCPVRVEEWFDSLGITNSASYDFGYNVGYNEGFTNGVAASSDPYYNLTNAKFDLGMLDNNNDFYYVFRNRDIELVDNYYDFTQYVFNALSEYHSEGYESEYIELEVYDFQYFNGASYEINVQGFTKIYISYDRNETEVINIGDPSSLETIELRSEGLVTDFTLLVDPNYTNQQTYKLGFNYLNTYENGYESGYTTGLKNGRNEVINDPNKYNLYNATQYDNYGKAQYQTGYNEGIRQEAPTGLEWFKSAISVTNAFLDIQILPGVKLIHICGGFIILGLLKWILDWFRG